MENDKNKPYGALTFGKTDPMFKEIYADKLDKPTSKEKRKFSKIRTSIGRKKKRSTSEMD
jgi:hypothetical protein